MINIKNRNDFVLAIIFFLGSIFFYANTYFFRDVMYFSLGPLVFPRILLGIMFILSISLLLKNLQFGSFKDKSLILDNQIDETIKNYPKSNRSTIIRALLIFLLLIYILMLPYLGYVISTIGFLFLAMLLLGIRSLKMIIVYGIISSLIAIGLKYVFGNLLRLFLP